MEHIAKERFRHIGEDAKEREAIARPSMTFMQDAIRRHGGKIPPVDRAYAQYLWK